MVMDEAVRLKFDEISTKLEELKVQVGQLLQWKENGEKQEDRNITAKGMRLSYDRLIVAIIALGFGIWQIIKEVLARL